MIADFLNAPIIFTLRISLSLPSEIHLFRVLQSLLSILSPSLFPQAFAISTVFSLNVRFPLLPTPLVQCLAPIPSFYGVSLSFSPKVHLFRALHSLLFSPIPPLQSVASSTAFSLNVHSLCLLRSFIVCPTTLSLQCFSAILPEVHVSHVACTVVPPPRPTPLSQAVA